VSWLNYHHLHYFWVVAREGSIARASAVLHLSPPAISTQLRRLEESLGERLFEKRGRGLHLTEAGRLAYRYADEIFTLGREFQAELAGRPTGRPLRLTVGISDVLPKLLVHRLLKPALRLEEPLCLVCREGTLPELLEGLQSHDLDLVLSDIPCSPQSGPKAFNHLLGECGVELLGTPGLVDRYPGPYPKGLQGAPVLLPSRAHALRRELDACFERHGITPVVAGEFHDSALLKTFGAEGEGFFTAPAAIAPAVAATYAVQALGALEGLRERVYAITAERKLVHPAVVAILEAARREVFG